MGCAPSRGPRVQQTRVSGNACMRRGRRGGGGCTVIHRAEAAFAEQPEDLHVLLVEIVLQLELHVANGRRNR